MTYDRRSFFKNTLTASLAIGGLSATTASSSPAPARKKPEEYECRNKTEGMVYRPLGNTGIMVSEMVMGGTIGPQSGALGNAALEAGINYFDTAHRYANGNGERGLGVLAKDSSKRDRMYISTKASSYLPFLDNLCMDIFKGLPQGKQEKLRRDAEMMIAARRVMHSGYYYSYFEEHDQELPVGYLTHAILLEYGYQKKWRQQLKDVIINSLNESLERLKTDYVDILHCPHGARLPEELDNEVISEAFGELKKAGKVRFSGLSIHSDVAEVLAKASTVGCYDMAMPAYNFLNSNSVDAAIYKSSQAGMGIIAMKAARSVEASDGAPTPEWRFGKLNTAIPGDMTKYEKAYLWVLQNNNVSAVISAIRDTEMLKQNIKVVGKKVEIKPV
jgi:aryl-alcohol dehydrogenase-like predicted oxidoreductase